MRHFAWVIAALVLGSTKVWAESCTYSSPALSTFSCIQYDLESNNSETSFIRQECDSTTAGQFGYDGHWASDACDASAFNYKCVYAGTPTVTTYLTTGAIGSED